MSSSILLLSVSAVIHITTAWPASMRFKTDTRKIILAKAKLDQFLDRPRVAPASRNSLLRTNVNNTELVRIPERCLNIF